MIRVARVWYNVVASYHGERALDHARRRDRALRELERMERDHQRRQTQREIEEILAARPAAVVAAAAAADYAAKIRSVPPRLSINQVRAREGLPPLISEDLQ